MRRRIAFVLGVAVGAAVAAVVVKLVVDKGQEIAEHPAVQEAAGFVSAGVDKTKKSFGIAS